jgi:hypothetical protein
VLRSAAFLAGTSHPNRPSAVRRGRHIVEQLLCGEIPPPPPDVAAVVGEAPAGASQRETEEIERADDYCQGCHSTIDPVGFSLGSYDAIGSLAAIDNLGQSIDNQTALPDGTTLDGVNGLADWLVANPNLGPCTVRKTFTYALGREPTDADDRWLETLEQAFVEGGYSFEPLLLALVESDPFLMIAGEVVK